MHSKTSEDKWIDFLKNKPHWKPTQKKIVILSPHPDDETLSVGGLIADLKKDCDITIIAVTDGENAYEDVDAEYLRQVRIVEQNNALALLGIAPDKLIRLGIKDSAVALEEEYLKKSITPFIDSNTLLIAPWIEDYHPDHKSVGNVALHIANQTSASLVFCFFWTWHQSGVDEMMHLPLVIYSLDDATHTLKRKAIFSYVSQLEHPIAPILTLDLLKPALRPFEVFCIHENR